MQNQQKSTQESDITFPNPPGDGISCLAVNGSVSTPTTMLIAGSWDNSLYMYELQYGATGTLSNILKHNQLTHEGPVLCADIASDGMTCFSGGCDGSVRMWNATQPVTSAQVIGKHDQPVRNLKFLPEMNVLATSGWDKSLRLWDCRSPTPVANIALSDRAYAMDARGQAIVVGTADKMVSVFQVQNKIGDFKSVLNYQTRCISIFNDCQGFVMGSIEGRVAIETFDEMQYKISNKPLPTNPGQKPKSFAFKFHRDEADIFSVNAVDFHKYNTFCTAGSDGTFAIWDKEAKERISWFTLHKRKCPISAVKFSPMGNMIFYALSYEWSKGAEHNNPAMGNNICVHALADVEVHPKPPKTGVSTVRT